MPSVRPNWISPSLELPNGYQKFCWYTPTACTWKDPEVYLDQVDSMEEHLSREPSGTVVRMYTQHLIKYQEGIFKQTRSSPNWEGGLVTYATCKHNLRSTITDWEGVWLVGLCPKNCESNAVLFAGKISSVFSSNYSLRSHIIHQYPKSVYRAKNAHINPRGDLYTPVEELSGDEVYDHNNYREPPNHTRSVEHYTHSAGTPIPADGKIPKWWRD